MVFNVKSCIWDKGNTFMYFSSVISEILNVEFDEGEIEVRRSTYRGPSGMDYSSRVVYR